MKHRAPVLNAVILVLVFAAAVAAQSTEIEQLRSAAEQGVARAQFNLGRMHANRRVMDADGYPVLDFYVQAHTWMNLAASRTTPERAGDYRSARDKLAEKMAASQVAEAQRLAREWQPKTWEQLR